MSEDINDWDEELEALDVDQTPPAPPPPKTYQLPKGSTGDDDDEFESISGIEDLTKPWMKHHQFVLVRDIKKVNEIVDAAIAAGRCALDLETEGLDNRIVYDALGKPRTKHQIVGFCLSYDGLTGYYLPVRHMAGSLNLPVKEVEDAIARLCLAAQPKPTKDSFEKDPLAFREFSEPNKLTIYFWNSKFDQEFLYPITGIDWWHPESFEDGLLACFVWYSGDKGFGLKIKAKQWLRDVEGNPHEMIELRDLFPNGGWIAFHHLSPEEPACVQYACSDAICTYLLCTAPRTHEKAIRLDTVAIVKKDNSFTYRLEKQCVQAVRWMERSRVRVNRKRATEIMEENAAKRDEIRNRIIQFATTYNVGKFTAFEPSSPKQLSAFLFEEGTGGLALNPKPEMNEKSKQFKTDADTLEAMVKNDPENTPDILKWIVEYRTYEKMDGTYLRALSNNPDENDELRFDFKQTGAATGRFSAPARPDHVAHGFSGVPIHGVPSSSDLRRVFIAREGFSVVKADYAGQELRIAANVSGEMVWIKEFLEGDGDLHSITARAFFNKQEVTKEERKMGKVANFALLYGGGPAAIMRATGCDKLEASRRKQAFDKAVPTFAKWIKGQHEKVHKDNGVWTAFQRWIQIPAPKKELPPEEIKKQNAARERASTNYPIQGSGADIMKMSMVLLCKEFVRKGWMKQCNGTDSVRMLMTVHDEIVFEIKHELVQEALGVIVRIMASPAGGAKNPMTQRTEPWRVPLIVEPLIGLNWAGEYDYGMLMHGRKAKPDEKLKDIEILVGDRVYHKVPPWLEGHFKPGWMVEEGSGGEGGGHTPPVTPTHEPAPSPSVIEDVTPMLKPAASPPSPPVNGKVNGHAPVTNGKAKIAIIRLNKLTAQSMKQVGAAIGGALDPNGRLLRLTDGFNNTLIDPIVFPIYVNPEEFAAELTRVNLSDGQWFEG